MTNPAAPWEGTLTLEFPVQRPDGATEVVLVTGAAGRIGGYLRSRLRAPGRVLRLLDTKAPDDPPGADEDLVQASVTDLEALARAAAGADAVVHLAGIPEEADWEDLLEVNIRGTYAVLEACRRAGVLRVVLASSNHAVGFHRQGEELAADLLPRPDSFYGVTKVCGEALGSLYHDRHGMDVVCLRIGSCFDRPTDARMLETWLSPDDAGRLFDAALTAPAPGFALAWGVSANSRRRWSLVEAARLGYRPQDDAERYAGELDDLGWLRDDDRRVGGRAARRAR